MLSGNATEGGVRIIRHPEISEGLAATGEVRIRPPVLLSRALVCFVGPHSTCWEKLAG